MCFYPGGGLVTAKSTPAFPLLSCRLDSTVKEVKKVHGGKNGENKKEKNVNEDKQEKQTSKKKGQGKKGRKGKGRGKKSNREASEKDKTALKEFLDRFKGTRRLMVRASSLSFFIILLYHPFKRHNTGLLRQIGCLFVHVPADLDSQRRCNSLHPAERGEREAALCPRHQEDHGGHHHGPEKQRHADAAPSPAW